MIETSYAEARSNLARLLRRVTSEREIVVIKRRGHEAVAMVPASDLTSLVETAYLLRSPKNARRLLESMQQSLADQGQSMTVAELRRNFGLERGKEPV